jgi:hypothetical protein
MSEEMEAREKVRHLKTFYVNLLVYATVSVVCIIIWLVSGGGTFWPFWVIFGCAIAAFLQALRLGQLPIVEEFFPFLQPQWEEEQVKTLLGEGKKSPAKKTTTKRSTKK